MKGKKNRPDFLKKLIFYIFYLPGIYYLLTTQFLNMLIFSENVLFVYFKKKKIRTRLLQENNSKLLEIFYKFFRQTSCVGTRKLG